MIQTDKWARDQNYTSFGLRVSLKWEHEIVISQQILAMLCSPRHLIANCCNLSGSQLRTYVACNGYLSVFTACLWGKMLILNKNTCLVLGERKIQTTHILRVCFVPSSHEQKYENILCIFACVEDLLAGEIHKNCSNFFKCCVIRGFGASSKTDFRFNQKRSEIYLDFSQMG